jgi:enoyl-CoA hydratase/carnithine racemase
MSSDQVVLFEAERGVAVITLNRPDRLNAWTPEMEEGYFGFLQSAAADPQVKVIVLTGAGRGFCAGADMDLLQTLSQKEGGLTGRPRPSTFPLSIPKPIVAAINGACAGIGFVHALMCDIRFAAAGAKLTTAFSRRGLIAEHGMSWLLPRLVGQSVALDLLLSGRVFLAEEAFELGLLHKVVAPEVLLDEAVAYAHDIAENCSPRSMAVIKSQVYRHLDTDLDTALAESNRLMAESLLSSDFKEGVASFLLKARPHFAPLDVRHGG